MTLTLRGIEKDRFRGEMYFYIWGDAGGNEVRFKFPRAVFADRYMIRDHVSEAFEHEFTGEVQAACYSAYERHRAQIDSNGGLTVEIVAADLPAPSKLKPQPR